MVEAVSLHHVEAVWDDGWTRDGSRVETSDEALCRRVAQRDGVAFETLVERYQQRAYRLAWSILRDAEEARDLSQEAFIRLYEAAGSFRGTARFSTWFYRILVNLCLDARRRRRWWYLAAAPVDREDGSFESLVEQQPAATDDPVDELAREQVRAQLWKAVEGLSPQQRAALMLQVQEELPTTEIAAVLKCSEATVRVHLHRALQALRKTMRGERATGRRGAGAPPPQARTRKD
jgi:RNA polymerase sigma-70 factor (ECF subfamily)